MTTRVAAALHGITSKSAVVHVNGWVKAIRRHKDIAFIAVNDGSTAENLQVVVASPVNVAREVAVGASVHVVGTLEQSHGRRQKVELAATTIAPVGVSSDFPIEQHQHAFNRDLLNRDWTHLRPRTSHVATLLRLSSRLSHALSAYFTDHDYTQIHPPILTSSDAEGAGEQLALGQSASDLFKVSRVGLTVSTQLHLEACMMGLGKVWTMAPVFRADRSDTNRHVSEFRMVEAELAFVDDLDVLMDHVEDMLRCVCSTVCSDASFEELQHLDQRLSVDVRPRWKALHGKWRRITYHEAILELGVQNLSAEHERRLAQAGPVFVTHYPTHLKPFYMLPSSRATVACFDLLLPDLGELVGGSLREHRVDELTNAMRGLEDMEWYADLRRWGTVPHGGYGMGFERLVTWLAGVNNIRDVIAFPRWRGHIRA